MGMGWNIGFDLEMDFLNYFHGIQGVLDSEQISGNVREIWNPDACAHS